MRGKEARESEDLKRSKRQGHNKLRKKEKRKGDNLSKHMQQLILNVPATEKKR